MLTHSLTHLKSGLTVIRVPMESVKSVTFLALCNTGSRYETPKVQGIAHFFEHMVFKGTAKYPDAQTLAATIDSVGADFNAFTSKEYTGYYVQAASMHLGLAVDVVSDMLLQPNLRQEDIDREKSVIIEEMNMYKDSPARHIGNLYEEMIYADEGLRHDIIGTKETIHDIDKADFTRFLKAWYGLENMTVVVAGEAAVVNDPATLELIERAFAKEAGERAKGKIKLDSFLSKGSAWSKERIKVEFKKTEQAHFILGWPGLKRTNENRYTLSLLSTVLGGNMSSRLFTEIREKRGLCYYVHSDVDYYHETGMVGASAGVDPKRVEEAIEVTVAEFQAVADGSKVITAEELKKAKDYTSGKLILSLEDSQSVAQYYGMKQLLSGEIITPDEVLKRYNQVTLEEVQALATQLIQANQVRLAVIGPYKSEAKFKKALGY